MKQTIVITGFMGCGKSRVAQELARRLDVPMIDLDERITASEGRTPAQLITESGEPAFRSIETNALREVLETTVAGVIALGGGAWIETANRNLIDQHGCVSVWLDAPFAVCWERISASTDERPLGKTIEQAEARYNARKPIYALAKIQIPVTGAEDVDDLVSHIETHLSTDVSTDYTD
ncbi:MAG TPA: shikimate kinase [Pyrinomonadaceae bacterium]|nr:shikimate kinase [Pyrinomonadaceae bacterium]